MAIIMENKKSRIFYLNIVLKINHTVFKKKLLMKKLKKVCLHRLILYKVIWFIRNGLHVSA